MDHVRPQCAAEARSTGKRCGLRPIPGRTVCRAHGGLTPSLQRLKTGLHSKLPSRLAESYARGLEDATLLDQRRSIALMESLVEEMAQRIQEGDPPEMRQRAAGLASDALLLLDGGDAKAARALLKALTALLREGLVTDVSRDKLFAMTDRVGARRDAAWNTKLQRVQVMNANDVATLLGLVLLRARAKWGEGQARELAEMFESLLRDQPAVPGMADGALATINVEGQTVPKEQANGNAAAGS